MKLKQTILTFNDECKKYQIKLKQIQYKIPFYLLIWGDTQQCWELLTSLYRGVPLRGTQGDHAVSGSKTGLLHAEHAIFLLHSFSPVLTHWIKDNKILSITTASA